MTAFPILQFGTSRFLQAHVDLFVSQALARGEAMGRIAVVQTTSSKESRKRLDAFAAGKAYRVQVKGLAGGKIVDEDVEVTSVGAGFDASSQWDEVERLFNEAHCAVSNTADRGYEIDPADRPNAGPPRSFPAKLAKLMLARHRAGPYRRCRCLTQDVWQRSQSAGERREYRPAGARARSGRLPFSCALGWRRWQQGPCRLGE